jgi:hypothetical protein
MIIQVGDSPMDVAAVIFMQNRDAVLERIARDGDRKGETKLISLGNPEATKEVGTMKASGWEVLCFVLPEAAQNTRLGTPSTCP